MSDLETTNIYHHKSQEKPSSTLPHSYAQKHPQKVILSLLIFLSVYGAKFKELLPASPNYGVFLADSFHGCKRHRLTRSFVLSEVKLQQDDCDGCCYWKGESMADVIEMQSTVVQTNTTTKNIRKMAMIKSSNDTRYATDAVVIHDGVKFLCWTLPDLSSFKHCYGVEAYDQQAGGPFSGLNLSQEGGKGAA